MAKRFLSKEALLEELEQKVGRIEPELKAILQSAVKKQPPYGPKDVAEVSAHYARLASSHKKLGSDWYVASHYQVTEAHWEIWIEPVSGASIASYPMREKMHEFINDFYPLGNSESEDIEGFLQVVSRHGLPGGPLEFVTNIGYSLYGLGQDDLHRTRVFFDHLGTSSEDFQEYISYYTKGPLEFTKTFQLSTGGWDPIEFFTNFREPRSCLKAHADKLANTINDLADSSPAKKERALGELLYHSLFSYPIPIVKRDRVEIKWLTQSLISGAYIYLLENTLEGRWLRICQNPGCKMLFFDVDPSKKYCSNICRNRAGAARIYQKKKNEKGASSTGKRRPTAQNSK